MHEKTRKKDQKTKLRKVAKTRVNVEKEIFEIILQKLDGKNFKQ